jgi:hypothetical protein
MEGCSDPTLNFENDEFMNSMHNFTQVTDLTMSKKIVNYGKEWKDDVFNSLSNITSSFGRLKKLSQENENFPMAELNDKAREDKSYQEENSTTMINTNINSEEFLFDEDKIDEMEIDSEFEFININEVKDSNIDEKFCSSRFVENESDKEKSFLETSPVENEEIEDENKNNIPKKKCLNCGLKNARKGRNYCKKCPKNKSTKVKCGCNKPHYAKGMCFTCYDRTYRRNLPKPDKMCINCNSKTAVKRRNFCKGCCYVTNKNKPYKCDCDKPHFAKGLCRSCYYKRNKNKNKPFMCNCDKPHFAKGLCKSCYNKRNKTKKNEEKNNLVA